jgi:ribonuclease HII
MLRQRYTGHLTEAGCDEAGRGCLAGPVFAAAVIFPPGYSNPELNDSKKLSPAKRHELRYVIEQESLAWAVASASPAEIDEINILNASIRAMHRAVSLLGVTPELLLIDGNRFHPYPGIRHRCIIRGDGLFLSIAAASVLAKTCRDDYMKSLHKGYPGYGWDCNKGYPTAGHREAVHHLGLTLHHRKTFHMKNCSTFTGGRQKLNNR